jgi:WD40 repeat protein/Flp pilus assembly protein TadD
MHARDPLVAEIRAAHLEQAHDDPFADRLIERLAGTPGTVAAVTVTSAAAGIGTDGRTPRAQPKRVPGFEILGELGHGGMGIVYKARQAGLNRLVALKMIRAGEYASQQDLMRFLSEAQAVARLQHPRIVQVFEVNRHQNRPYLVMELLEGGSLSARLGGKPQGPRYAAEIVESLAGGVHFAHAHGIVHRDLKPANILLTAEGTPKITDFGIAKCLEGGTTLTETGMVLGTPSYMAPEQAAGTSKTLGPGCDVYALGAILYEMLTGRPPFQAATPLETLEQVRSQEVVPPRRLQPKAPRDLETICLKCLRKEPSLRYSSAALLAEDLGRYLRDEPILARPVGELERLRRWCRRNPAVAGLTAAVACLLVVTAVAATVSAFWFGHVAQEAEGARLREAAERQKAVGTLATMYTANGLATAKGGDPARAVLWYANSARMELDPARQEASWVRIRAWSRLTATPVAVLPHAGRSLTEIAFHPAGGHLLSITGEQRFLIWDLAREQPLPWAIGDGEAAFAAWTPDGRSVVLASARGDVVIRRFPDGEIRQRMSHGSRVRAMALSPRGRFLALGGRGARVWDMSKRAFVSSLLAPEEQVVAMTFNPKEDRLAIASADLMARVFAVPGSPAGAHPLFPPVPHRQPDIRYEVGPAAPAFIDQGRGLITVTGLDRVGRWDAEKGDLVDTMLFRNDAGTPQHVYFVAAPGDGSRFVAAGFSGAQIWDAQNGRQVGKFLGHQNYVTAVAFCPDGRTVVTAGEDRRAGLWSLARGEATPSPLVHQASLRLAAYSSDGRVLATAQNDGLVRVWAPPGGNPRNHYLPYDGNLTFARLSPDGRHVVTSGAGWWPNTLRTARVYEVATGRPAGPLLEVGGLITNAALSPDGCHVATLCSLASTPEERNASEVVPEGKAGRLQIWSWQTGRPACDPVPLPAEPRGVAYSPDGMHLAAHCAGGQIVMIDPPTGKVIRRLRHGRSITADNTYPSVMFTRDGASFLTWGANETTQVWETATGKPRHAPLSHKSLCYGVDVSRNGRLLVTSSWDGTARVWDFQSGQPISEPLHHADWVFSACFTRDGNLVLTGCRDGTAQLWDWRKGQTLTAFQHKDAVFTAAFSPDERWVVTASRDDTACIWDRQTGRPVTPSFPLPSDVWCALVTPDGRYAVLAGPPRALVAWSLEDLRPEKEKPVDDLCLLAEILSGYRLQDGSEVGLTTTDWLERWRAWRAKYPVYGQVEPGSAPGWHRFQAEDCEANGDLQAALWHLDHLIETAPHDAELRGFRGRISARLGHWLEAAADYGEMIDRAASWEALYLRGLALHMAKKHAAAIADFSAALLIDQQHAMVLQQRALAYLEGGQHQKAISDCDLALKLDPIFAPAFYTRGLAYKEMGRTQQADADRRQAKALNPQVGK